MPRPANTPDDDDTFSIAILGDFGGGPINHLESPSQSPVAKLIDTDNFDKVLATYEPGLIIPSGETDQKEITVRFRRLEDFHPDALLQQIGPLSRLLELRSRLLDPAHAEAALAEAKRLNPCAEIAPAAPTSTESAEDLLSRLMEKPAAQTPRRSPEASTLEQLIKQIVAPGVVSAPTQEQSQMVQQVEEELSTRLRDVLHHPDFQALEATWRGIDFLIREVSDQIKIYLIDLTKADLALEVVSGELEKAPFFKRLKQLQPALILGIYTFGPTDQPLLTAMGSLAEALGTTFVAGASPQLVGCRSFGLQPDPDDWTDVAALDALGELRRSSSSAHLGLLTPRFLLRQPFGSDPIEAFPFQEILSRDEHETYLWGNPSILCACLIADTFASEGWPFEPRGGQILGLPVHTLTHHGEKEAKPCAEAWLSEKATKIILACGIMPLLSIRGRDAVEIKSLKSFSIQGNSLIMGL